MRGAQSGAWDVVFVGILPARTAVADFSAPYAQIEGSYLVGKNSKVSAIGDMDQPGVRVAVLEKGAADNVLTPLLKQAALIRTSTVNEALELVKSEQADAVAALKTFLFPASDRIPGSRVLEGHIFVEQIGIGVPKGRETGAAFVRKFVDEAKASGLVKGIVERAAQRGFVTAP
jgi:polar amino acid transport system substrate-binding protein